MTSEGKNPAAAAAADASKPVHVMELLKQFDFLSIGLGGKIHCALTNRDLPLNTVAVQQHLNSKKLKKEREWYNADFSKYEPLIVAHKTNPKLLFCTLTRKELNRIPKQVEAHVNGKRFKNRKAEAEGLKQAQRQPMKEESEEEEEESEEEGKEEDDADFWMPTGGADVEAMEEDESDLEKEEEEEEEEKEKEEAGERKGAAGGRTPRGGKARGANNKAGAQAGKNSKGSGKGGKAKKTTKGGRKDDGDAAQENGASGVKEVKGRAEKKGGAKTKQRAGGKEADKPATKSGKSGPLSDDTPAVSNTATKDAAAAAATALPSPSAKTKSKAKSPKKKKAKGAQTPEGKGIEGASPVTAKSATKRKHKVSEEPASSGKKKRKA